MDLKNNYLFYKILYFYMNLINFLNIILGQKKSITKIICFNFKEKKLISVKNKNEYKY